MSKFKIADPVTWIDPDGGEEFAGRIFQINGEVISISLDGSGGSEAEVYEHELKVRFESIRTNVHHVDGGILKMADGSEVVAVSTFLHCSQGEDAHYNEIVAACEAIGAPDATIMTTRDDVIACVSNDGWVYRYTKLTGGVPQGLTGRYSVGDKVGAYRHIMPQTD